MEQVKIVRMDNQGRGIGYLDKKIIFIPNTIFDEEVLIDIVCDKKSYAVGKVIKYIKKSPKRIVSICPYYNECGGCQLLHMNYNDTIDYKVSKINNILKHNNIHVNNIDIIKNNKELNYRNKIELKINNKDIGYYENESHSIVNIDNCYIANDAINNVIKDIKKLSINSGDITIRSNYNQELLIVINTNDNVVINYESIKKNNKIVGIVLNNKIIYGEPFFIERIDSYLFRVSYDAFFQVNRDITKELFAIINKSIAKNSIVLDLFSGVGTLGIIASKKARKVYSIEIVKNAIKDGLINAKMNKIDNIYFILGDVSKGLNKIKDKIDTVIIDPPRKGLDKNTINYLMNQDLEKIIYISCDPMTLVRDLKVLKDKYSVRNFYILDMFSYTYHCESVVILERK